MASASNIQWTNESVRRFAKGQDPLRAVQDAARSLVLKAREGGWQGPPFNPLRVAEMLGARVEANSSVADARLVITGEGAKIEYNPKQPRERVRFSIAHEVAHLLFPDWHEEVRNRGGSEGRDDDWQLEMLCNVAASEFILPIGSLKSSDRVPAIEELMRQRREYDVSAEAFLVRVAKVSSAPVGVFFASPIVSKGGDRDYRVDYLVTSPTGPRPLRSGSAIPRSSVVRSCTAIGYTDKAVEDWVSGSPTLIECVGLPAFPGSSFPRVAGLVRFEIGRDDRRPIKTLHGDVLSPRGEGKKILCQLVNDRAKRWGGGVARRVGRRFPEAERSYAQQLSNMPFDSRLGRVIFSEADHDLEIASLIAQEGFGKSSTPRIRYSSLQRCLEAVTEHAQSVGASIHMPRIGTGAAGGDWGTIEEMLDDAMVRAGLSVTVYDLPPKRVQLELF